MPALSVTFDHAQSRVLRDRQWVLAAGIDFNGDSQGYFFENTWIDSITHRLMLRPGPMFQDWWTSNSGIYAKLALADLTVATPSSWIETEDIPGAGVYVVAQGVNEPAITTDSYPKNQAWWVSCFVYSAGDIYILAEGGWNDTATLDSGVGFRLLSNGQLDIFKDGRAVGSESVSGLTFSNNAQNQRMGLMFIPWMGREMLVVSSEGSGFNFVFEDIEEGESDPTITPAGKFWISQPGDVKAHFQLAPIQYPESGYAVTRLLSFAETPGEMTDPAAADPLDTFAPLDGPYGRFFYGSTTNAIGTSPAFFLRNRDNSADFMTGLPLDAENEDLQCRIKVTLSGDQSFSPVIEGCEVFFSESVVDTDDADAFTVDQFLVGATLDVPEDPWSTQLTLEVKYPKRIDTDHVRNFLTGGNRPVKAEIEGCWILDGVSEPAVWHTDVDDEVQRATVVVRDRTKSLEKYVYQDITVHDGREFSEAIAFNLARIGLTSSDWDLETTTLTLGDVPCQDANDWNVAVHAGSTAAGDIRELIEDCAPGYYARFRPQGGSAPKFAFKSPDTLSAAPERLTLYRSIDDAEGAGLEEGKGWTSVFRRLEQSTVEPEANDIRITGRDPRTGKAFQIRKVDFASLDPRLATSDRPDNWLGEIRRAGTSNPRITTVDIGTQAANYWAALLGAVGHVGEVECEMLFYTVTIGEEEEAIDYLVPVWVGDRLIVDEEGTFKVMAFSTRFEKEPADEGEDVPIQWRDSRYVLGEGNMFRAGGTTLESIRRAHELRAAKADNLIIRPGGDILVRRTPASIVRV